MRARAATSVALFAVVAALLAGCGFFVPVATQEDYDPTDGINADIGELELRNVLVITEDGILGNLLMTAVNHGERDLQVTLQWESSGTKHNLTVPVPGDTATQFGYGDNGQLLLEEIGTEAGGLLELYVQFGDEPGEQLDVPVLDGSLPQYQDFVPVIPLPSPTPEPTPSATEESEEEGE